MRARGLGLALAFVACRGPAPAVVSPPKKVESAREKKPAVETTKIVDDKVEILARVPAYFAESSGPRIYALAPDRSSVSAVDLATGTMAWTTKLTAPLPTKIVPSFGTKKRLLLHGQGLISVLEAQTGALVKESEGAYSEPYIEQMNGICLADEKCSVRFLDCDDGHPYGPRLSKAITHLYAKMGEPHDNVCWGPLMVLGRAKNLIVAVTDGYPWDQQEPPITVAIDANTEKTVWSSRTHGCRFCAHEASGMASDASACWVSDVDGKLDVFDCATGASSFATKVEKSSAQPEVFSAWAGAIFVSAKRAALLDAKTGKPRWSIDLPPDGLALPLGVPLELPKFSNWGAHTVLLVDPKTGKEIARFSQPESTEIVQAEDLGLGLARGPSFDAHGKARDTKVDTFTLDREHVPRALLAKGTKVLEVATDLALVGQSTDRAAIFVWGRKGESGALLIAKLR
jgi:outer membrane protein assembly factor BamB